MQKKKIVILGGGFAGMYSALSIYKEVKNEVEITLINKTNHFLFTPMLHEVATGSLGHHNVVESIREIVYKKHIHFLEASVESINTEENVVHTSRGDMSYDALVVALGATTNYFNTKGAAENTLSLKDLGDAIRIRNRIIARFEEAASEKNKEKQKQLLSFVVVGGGATGVELAGEIAEFAGNMQKKYYSRECGMNTSRVTLIQAMPELLSAFEPASRAYALKILKRSGISVMLNTKVQEVTKEGVVLSDGTLLPSSTVIWTAGVQPNTVVATPGALPLHASGRIQVDTAFEVEGIKNIFSVGDGAAVLSRDGKPYPMLAQVAVRQGRLIGKNIKHFLRREPLEHFSYKLVGELVSLGRFKAVGTIFGVQVSGPIAWYIWRTVYLFKFISSAKRVKIAVDWTVNLFYPRDVTRV